MHVYVPKAPRLGRQYSELGSPAPDGLLPPYTSNSFVASPPLFKSRARMPSGRSSSGYSRGSPSEMTKLSTWTYTRYTPRLSGGIYDPNRTSFELQLNSDMALWLSSGRPT
jgi:hypothetical protein